MVLYRTSAQSGQDLMVPASQGGHGLLCLVMVMLLPSDTPSQGSTPDTDGSWRVKAGGTVMSHILIIEVSL